jgi:two-component system response regulator WspF
MRIAIVNDMALAREVLRRVVVSVPGYTVAWQAVDGAEAIRKATEDRPDAILMDLIMPGINGVEATRRIMASSPCPILVVTSDVAANFHLVYEAMGLGALDAVNTPGLSSDGRPRNAEPLLDRLARLSRINQSWQAASPSRPKILPAAMDIVPPLIVLGASTGGPDALARVLGAWPIGFPGAVVVVQHIGAEFAPGLAAWLQARTALPVSLAKTGEGPTAGAVRLAGEERHLILTGDRRFAYSVEPSGGPYLPSVDVFFDSVAAHWPRPGVGLLLTGMGSDGARGLLHLRRAGWFTMAQDEATCVVYGMPKVAAELSAACQILPLMDLAPAVAGHLRNMGKQVNRFAE